MSKYLLLVGLLLGSLTSLGSAAGPGVAKDLAKQVLTQPPASDVGYPYGPKGPFISHRAAVNWLSNYLGKKGTILYYVRQEGSVFYIYWR